MPVNEIIGLAGPVCRVALSSAPVLYQLLISVVAYFCLCFLVDAMIRRLPKGAESKNR
jgi:hypothetical protein